MIKVNKKGRDCRHFVHIPMKVYPFSVLFSFGNDDDQIKSKLLSLEFTEDELSNGRYKNPGGEGSYSLFFEPGQNFALIRMKHLPQTSKDFSVLAHEIFHVVCATMEKIGMQLLHGTSDEAYAYLISYLTEELYLAINEFY